MQAAEQSEDVLHADSTESQPIQGLDQEFLGVRYQDGRLWMRSENMNDGVTIETTLRGYVQEGGRLLLLWREEMTSENYNSLGIMVGVCTNCD